MWRLGIIGVFMLGLPALAQSTSPLMEVSCEREAECLARLNGLAKREGELLFLRLENGKSEIYLDDRQACKDDNASDCVKYKLRAYRPDQKLFVVGYSLYEGSGANVVSAKSGRTVFLTNLPVFSPNGRFFAAADSDPHYERKYEIAVWSFVSGKAKQEFTYSTPKTAREESWEVLGWDGNDRIKLKVGIPDDAYEMQESETKLVRTKQGWKLNWPLPNSK
ncbi:hypothetical protein BB934_12540 [Microvirga ossetica]|uniref:Uncharacterized protein n=1 Tax=Microvirga ossetica TaxID=1882682 RepID=A0A1B2EG28_9HYPH|nr:hypothetical protein [Microvirga ossetica]ANY78935.1 hypothetical protein BB934_12540 [Microvirga ossetica]